MNNPPDFWRRDYPFHEACVQPPPPLRKKSEKGCLWRRRGGGENVHRLVSDGLYISSSSEKRADKKIPVSSVFNDSEGLYGTTVCRCLVRRPNYSARLMRFGSSGPSEFATLRRRRTGTMHNVYRSVREKQGNFVYRQRVLQTVTLIFCVLFH